MLKTNIEVLNLIAGDMKKDAESFDGRPFNGKVVAQYFGNQGAAISAIAMIIKAIVEETTKETPKNDQTT